MMLRRFVYIAFAFFLLLAWETKGQGRHALLVGIGDYPEESGWNRIHGNNDVSIIKANLLRQGFLENNIIELRDSLATKKNILDSFGLLLTRLSSGDVVYLHFSGHGQQITDLNGDEEDGYDEAWIPYDAKKVYVKGVYEGESHLADDELNALLTQLRGRVGIKGKIIVVADACHSGSGSRNYTDDEVFVRGTSEKFIIPHQAPSTDKKSGSTEWLFVAACKSYQSNYEYRAPNGDYYGVLSYVIANDIHFFDQCRYLDLLKNWSRDVSTKSRYPQDIDNEGQPSRRNSFMF
jgi:hypothetical protein